MHEALEGIPKGELISLRTKTVVPMAHGDSMTFPGGHVQGRFHHVDKVGVHLEDREGDMARIRHEDVYDVHRPLRKT